MEYTSPIQKNRSPKDSKSLDFISFSDNTNPCQFSPKNSSSPNNLNRSFHKTNNQTKHWKPNYRGKNQASPNNNFRNNHNWSRNSNQFYNVSFCAFFLSNQYCM